MTTLKEELQTLLESTFGEKKSALNDQLGYFRNKIRSGEGTDEDIDEYNNLIDQLVVCGAEKSIPDEFWHSLGQVVDDAVRCRYPSSLNGTTYIKYKADDRGIEVKEVVHQKRDGRPPTSYQLIVDGHPMRRRDFLLQYCGETDNRISWSKVRQYAKDLVDEQTFHSVLLQHWDNEGNMDIYWSLGG